jgi:7-cyano-7-deazaguanine synthase
MASAILLSGGIDSIALACWRKPDLAITIDYGQVCAEAEEIAAREAAAALQIPHELLRVDCATLGSGILARRDRLHNAPTPEWWPYRNQLLVTIGVMRAIRSGIREVWVGTVSGDGRHADGRPQFIKLIDELVAMQEGALRVKSPAIGMSSTELVRISGATRSLMAWAHSCHRHNSPCGACRGCYKHEAVMQELGWDS